MKKGITVKLLTICLLVLMPIIYYANVSAKKPADKAVRPKAASRLPAIRANSKFRELLTNVYKPNELHRPGESFHQPAHVVKTDGKYLYWINGGWQVHIIDANRPEQMKIIKGLKFKYPDVNLKDVLVSEDHLVVIGIAYEKTMAFIYDISDRSDPRKTREVRLQGDYVSSQVIGSHFYLLANNYVDALSYQELFKNQKVPGPSYNDSIAGKSDIEMSLKDVNYLPNSRASDYLVVMGLNLDKPKEKPKVNAYFGAGVNTYVAGSNIYVPVRHAPKVSRPETAIYKFELYEGQAYFMNKGVVAGTLQNKVAINEHKGNIRIVTISGASTNESGAAATNNIFVLDKNLKTLGSIQGIAKKLSARVDNLYIYLHFAGDRLYLENFRNPPLIAVDLENPKAPKVLGPIKTPISTGFLNPYQGNLYIGLGETHTETGRTDGMKLMMVDLGNAKNPKVRYEISLGDRGTQASMLSLDNERNLLAVALYSTKLQKMKPPVIKNGKSYFDENSDLGKFVFQGAHVYVIVPGKGLELKGKIVHISKKYPQHISNILILKDVVYAFSPGKISTHEIETLKDIKSISIEPPPRSPSKGARRTF